MKISRVDVENCSKEKAKSNWYHIEKSMISCKLAFFLVNGRDSCYIPYQVLFLISIGLSPSQIGMINCFAYLGGVFGMPLLGLIADRYHSHFRVIELVTACSLLFQVCQPFVPLLLHKPQNTNLTDALKGNITDLPKESNTDLFYLILSANIIFTFFDGNFVSFIDSAVIQRIRLSLALQDFGFQRLFGSIGFGSFSIIAGICVSYFPNDIIISHYSPIYFLYSTIILCLAIDVFPIYRAIEGKFSKVQTLRCNVKILLIKQFKNLENLFFFSTVFTLGVAHAFYISFFSLLLSDLEAPDVLTGLAVGVGCVSEIAVFKYTTNIVNFLNNIWITLLVAMFSYVVRFTGFYLIKSPWYILLIQLLCQGPGFALPVAGYTLHTKAISPEPILTSMCSVTNMLFIHFANALASLIGGFLIEKFHLKNIYLVLCFICLFWCLIMLLFIRCLALRKKEQSPNNSSTGNCDLASLSDINCINAHPNTLAIGDNSNDNHAYVIEISDDGREKQSYSRQAEDLTSVGQSYAKEENYHSIDNQLRVKPEVFCCRGNEGYEFSKDEENETVF